MRLVQVAELGKVGSSLFVLSNLDQPTRRLDGEEAGDGDDHGEVDVHHVGDNPLELSVARDVETAAPGCEVGKHDSQVDGSREHADTETTNGAWCDLSQVSRGDDGGLSDADTCDESAGVHQSQAAVERCTEEHDDADDPQEAKLTCCPETSNLVGKVESDQSTKDRAHLDHSSDVSECGGDLFLALSRGLVQTKDPLERRLLCACADETLVKTTGSAHETEDCSMVLVDDR